MKNLKEAIWREIRIFMFLLTDRETTLSTSIGVGMMVIGIVGFIYFKTDWLLSNKDEHFRFDCTDLRDGQKFSFNSNDPDQIAGKYQISPGVYLDKSDSIKCLQKRIKINIEDPKKTKKEKNDLEAEEKKINDNKKTHDK